MEILPSLSRLDMKLYPLSLPPKILQDGQMGSFKFFGEVEKVNIAKLNEVLFEDTLSTFFATEWING